MTLGEKLQKLRKERKLSQDQLALEMEVSRQSISKWELGESTPDTEHAIALSHFFGVSIDYLLKDDISISDDKELKISQPPHKSWVSSISVGVMIIGLLLSTVFWSTFQSWVIASVGIVIQLVAFVYFMVNHHYLTDKEQKFVCVIGAWLILLFPSKFFIEVIMNYYPRPRMYFVDLAVIFTFYVVVCGGITLLLNRKKGTN